MKNFKPNKWSLVAKKPVYLDYEGNLKLAKEK